MMTGTTIWPFPITYLFLFEREAWNILACVAWAIRVARAIRAAPGANIAISVISEEAQARIAVLSSDGGATPLKTREGE